jgi:O-antigen/teichoic acid export membrane protein
MADPMTRLTNATMDLKKYTNVFNYWTFILIIIYIALLIANILFFTVLLELWLNIVAGVTLFFLIIAYLAVFFIKDTQKQIMLTLLRSMIGAALPIALIVTVGGPFALWLQILGAVLFLIGLLFLILILRSLLAMNQITKEFMKGQKSD